jgi:hypothetical protein
MVARPRADQAIEHGEPISFATRNYQVQVLNADPSAIGFVELPDMLAILAWLHRDALIAALDREIDEVADDPNALTDEQRRKAEVEILADLLAIERKECALVKTAQSQRLPADYIAIRARSWASNGSQRRRQRLAKMRASQPHPTHWSVTSMNAPLGR